MVSQDRAVSASLARSSFVFERKILGGIHSAEGKRVTRIAAIWIKTVHANFSTVWLFGFFVL
ncbi:hypothetical protein LEP1GSC131_2051 [Leptospira kirschneri str. 200802841]|uniref:Uncharacterized protein n=1 Tax=Leptospira kirschneri str. 200802841 TaxID=1193047 RepID=A0A828Y7R9_9LEPT|nr:hypothetical protein LEP1GSC131_2051 [Leptospira kirschneri str. 200802841]